MATSKVPKMAIRYFVHRKELLNKKLSLTDHTRVTKLINKSKFNIVVLTNSTKQFWTNLSNKLIVKDKQRVTLKTCFHVNNTFLSLNKYVLALQ